MSDSDDPRIEFLKAAIWHGSLDRAEAIRAAHPEVIGKDLPTAAVLGDDSTVRRLLAADPTAATKKGPPYDGDPLVYLCLSKYLRLEPSRSDAFVRAATALFDAGADPNTGFRTTGPFPEFETALYGAAGVAHHAELTRLLIARGADPNDEEVPYHSPETYDLGALKVLVESGKLTADSLATMLLRKADWHDHEGIKYLLTHGADPNRMTHWKFTALHQALRRDNGQVIVESMLDHGGDPTVPDGHGGPSAVQIAARRGRNDAIGLFEVRGFSVRLKGVENLLAACARDDAAGVKAISEREPGLVEELRAVGGTLLAEFAGNANVAGLGHLMELGVPVDSKYGGDGYFCIPPDSTAIHVAAWRAWPQAVKFLIDRGAPVNLRDGDGQTPLALAVKACVDSYWAYRRSPESVRLLLDAGATTDGISIPCGYDAVDELLRSARG